MCIRDSTCSRYFYPSKKVEHNKMDDLKSKQFFDLNHRFFEEPSKSRLLDNQILNPSLKVTKKQNHLELELIKNII